MSTFGNKYSFPFCTLSSPVGGSLTWKMPCARPSPSAPSSDLEVYNIGCHQDPHTLQKVPNHMDEGSSDAGVLLLTVVAVALVIMAVPRTMTVPMSRLIEG